MSRRIAIVGWNSATQYSGGRYHAWMLAEALVHAGHRLTYITNNVPLFARDFETFPKHNAIKIHLTTDFRRGLPGGDFDIVIMVPHTQRDPSFFLNIQAFVSTRHARFVTLNFETPNWFNAMSPVQRDLNNFVAWKRCCEHVDLIISSAKESVRYAREYFDNVDERTEHVDCYPSINTALADAVTNVKQEKRIFLFGRFFAHDAHKGSTQANRLFCEALRGYTLVFAIGTTDEPPALFKQWEKEAAKFGISIDLKFKMSDAEKFREIKRSCLVLFPSYFEGFGYPPIEALFCNVPCIAFDLPVVRETCGDHVYYVPVGDWDAFCEKIAEVLATGKNHDHLQNRIAPIATFESYVERMNVIVEDLMKRPPRSIPVPTLWQRLKAAIFRLS